MEGRHPFTWRRFGVTLGVALAVVTSFWIERPPRYLTNDDVAIRLAVEGEAVPGQPATGFVPTTHSALGWGLATLHRAMPRAPVWDLAVTATLIAAVTVLVSLAWGSLGTDVIARMTAAGAMLVAVIPLMPNIQFTIAATVAGGASMALALTEVASRRPRTGAIVMAAALMLAGLLVRPMGAAAGAATVGLFLVPWAAWHATLRGPRLARALATLAAAGILSVGLVYVDSLLYRMDAAWNAYYRYNWMAAQLAEWGGELPEAEVAAIREGAGWSHNDWMMLQRWFGVDPVLHGVGQVAQAYDARATTMSWDRLASRVVDRMAAAGASTVQQVAAESILLLVVIGTLAAVYTGWRGRGTLGVGFLLFLALCVAIAAVFKDLPFRLLAPLQACATAAVLVVVATNPRRPSPVRAIIGLAVVLTVLTYQSRSVLAAATIDHLHTVQVEREVADLQQRLSPALIVIHADAFPAEHWWRPFVRPAVALQAIFLSGNNQSPSLQRFLTDTGRQPLFGAVCDDPSTLVISDADRLGLVTTYFVEHFKRAIAWRQVYAGSFQAWRCAG